MTWIYHVNVFCVQRINLNWCLLVLLCIISHKRIQYLSNTLDKVLGVHCSDVMFQILSRNKSYNKAFLFRVEKLSAIFLQIKKSP